MDPIAPHFHHKPLKVAEDTYLIRQLLGEGEAPVSIYVNSMVINGREPVIVDTGMTSNRKQWMADVFSIVEPKDVKWIFLSHDDADHTGNLRQMLEICENATLVTNWFTVERLSGDIALPLNRMRWVNDGDSFEAGDRTFAAIRPPIYDAPTTRGLFDSKTGVYWAADCFAALVLEATENVADLDPQFWREGFAQVQGMVAPWSGIVDPKKFDATIKRVANLGVKAIASGHAPIVDGPRIQAAYQMLSELPSAPPVTLPGQAELEAMVAAMTTEQQAA